MPSSTGSEPPGASLEQPCGRDAPRKQPKANKKNKSGSTPKFSKEAKYQKPWNMQGCIRNEVAREFAALEGTWEFGLKLFRNSTK